MKYLLEMRRNHFDMLKLNNRSIIILLAIITGLGLMFRVIGFSQLPAGLNRDEAALGYNAYSLLQSGKDEWGVSWPIVFRSFGDYKLAGYIYTLIPFVQVFGLNAFSVRLPSLLAGITLIPLVYLLTKEVTKRKDLAVVGAMIQAISPWALHYSKVAFEANLALCLFVASVYLLFKRQSQPVHSVVGSHLLFLSLLTYNAPLIMAPFLLAVLLFVKKRVASIGVCVVAALAFVLVFPATKGKTGITVFSDVGFIEQQHRAYQNAGSNFLLKTISHPFVFYPRVIVEQYIKSYNPTFLVFQGGSNPWHQAPYSGHLTIGMYALFILGIVSAFFILQRQSYMLYVLLIISPFASAITVDAPQATRMLFFFLTASIFTAIGLMALWKYMKLVALLACVIVLFESANYVQSSLRAFLNHPQTEWFSGIGKAITTAEAYRKENELIGIVGDVHYMYIYPAFYTQLDPIEFLTTIEYFPNDAIGLSQVKKVGHYIFASNAADMSDASVRLQQIDGIIHVERVDRSKQ